MLVDNTLIFLKTVDYQLNFDQGWVKPDIFKISNFRKCRKVEKEN